MELIRGLHNLRSSHRGCVATIGNFDGVHLGHQAVLGQLAERAAQLHLPTCVILFEPHPRELFAPESAPPRLSRLREKLEALRRFSVDRVLCIRFTRDFAAWSATRFVEQVLAQQLGVRYLVVGDDFRFGQGRSGDFALLQREGARLGFQVSHMQSFFIDGVRVSSTAVREALMAGQLQRAEQWLGRRYRLSGRVAHGEKRGRQLGFPTANVYLHRRTVPLRGVFAVEVFGAAEEPWPGVANIGTRPTVNGAGVLLEVHLLDFAGDLYGRHLQVAFRAKLRDETKFPSLDALKAQIARDVDDARAVFGKAGKSDA